MTSKRLQLDDNTTCQLVSSSLNITFYTVDIKQLAVNSPLGRDVTLLSDHSY